MAESAGTSSGGAAGLLRRRNREMDRCISYYLMNGVLVFLGHASE
jgi:hypothetical protein